MWLDKSAEWNRKRALAEAMLSTIGDAMEYAKFQPYQRSVLKEFPSFWSEFTEEQLDGLLARLSADWPGIQLDLDLLEWGSMP